MKSLFLSALCLCCAVHLRAADTNAPAAPYILTPAAPATPRINGPGVFGVRPGSPFLYTIPATGDRPMTFSAKNLPRGLKLDAKTGRITGKLKKKGETVATLIAQNTLGTAEKKFRIEVGNQIALTPPMGWNSWNCFAGAVSEERVKSAADAMVKSGLINHGWTFINVDDYWQNHRDSKDPTLRGPFRDQHGNIVPNSRFPDMKGMADYIHGLGLKAGLYSSPGPWTCGGCTGSWQHEQQDAQTYAKWGFDYLKYDWCSYGSIASGKMTNVMRHSALGQDRDERRRRDLSLQSHGQISARTKPRHRFQPLPIRHGGRVEMGRLGQRQLLAHHRRHHRHLAKHERHRLQAGPGRAVRQAGQLERPRHARRRPGRLGQSASDASDAR